MTSNRPLTDEDKFRFSFTFASRDERDVQLYKEMVKPHELAGPFRMSPSQLERILDMLPVSDLVPSGIKAMIDRIRKLFLYGYLEYEFFTVASEQCFFLSEAALRTALPDHCSDPKNQPGMRFLIQKARERGLLPERHTDRMNEALVQLRNDHAHPRDYSLLLPTMTSRVYYASIDFVNCLFDPLCREIEPEVMAWMRKESQGYKRIADAVDREEHDTETHKIGPPENPPSTSASSGARTIDSKG